VVEFLDENIFNIFGVPKDIVTYQGTRFNSKLVQELMKRNHVKHKQSTPYHPQANGKVEVTNRELERILTKTIHLHRKY
jgi:transposase InsO family protein